MKEQLVCPFCSSKRLQKGHVWTSRTPFGRGAPYLDWAEGDQLPPFRVFLGRRHDVRIIDEPHSPKRAFRCLSCGSFLLYQPCVEEESPMPEFEPDDVTEPAECLSCGATIESGASSCGRCGWTYRT